MVKSLAEIKQELKEEKESKRKLLKVEEQRAQECDKANEELRIARVLSDFEKGVKEAISSNVAFFSFCAAQGPEGVAMRFANRIAGSLRDAGYCACEVRPCSYDIEPSYRGILETITFAYVIVDLTTPRGDET
jgi:hypothetical protein